LPGFDAAITFLAFQNYLTDAAQVQVVRVNDYLSQDSWIRPTAQRSAEVGGYLGHQMCSARPESIVNNQSHVTLHASNKKRPRCRQSE
jgi:hypothetical protein